MSRVIAIMSGDDWNDASVEHIEVPDDVDMEKLKKEYIARCRKEPDVYLPFHEWLIMAYNDIKTADVEEFWSW